MNMVRGCVAIATGGTGGHVFPALAFADALAEHHVASHFVTDIRGARYGTPETSLVLAMPHGVRGRILRMMCLMPMWLWRVMRLFRQKNVHLVVTFGSYAAIPAMIAARLMALPLIIHEQNAVLGRVNRYGARLASAIALSFAHTKPNSVIKRWKKKITLVGVPIREMTREFTKKDTSSFTIGVLGGSQGAHALSDIVPSAIGQLAHKETITVLHQARREDVDRVHRTYQSLAVTHDVRPFFDDMSDFYRRCDVLIARAGASTIAEATAMRLPLILIPYPHAANHHQDDNARAVAHHGAAIVVNEQPQAAKQLNRHLNQLMTSPKMMESMSRASARMSHFKAATKLALLARTMIKFTVEWYQKAAQQGDAQAQFNLGEMYRRGHGVTQDYEKAVEWYQKAAKQGDAQAQFNLGEMYRRGHGVTQNKEKEKKLRQRIRS